MRTSCTPLAALAAFWWLTPTPVALAQLPNRAAVVAFVDSLAAAEMTIRKVPGLSIAVVRGDDTLVAKGYGLADIENDVPATPRTVYRIGSVTKQFTAAAILRLAEEGKLSLDDTVGAHLPGYPTQGHRVTIRHLLNHTSGIKSYTSLGPRWASRRALELPYDTIVALFRDEPFDFAPGERFLYNNSGYYLLGRIIERASGQPYESHLRKTFFEPLGLGGTTYCDDRPIIKGRAEGYSLMGGAVVNDEPVSMRHPYSAGALCSTVIDLVAWTRALHGGRVVKPASLAAMTTPVPLTGGGRMQYGFGLVAGELAGHRAIAHGGSINGFQSHLAHYPDDRLTIAVLANSEAAQAERVEQRIARFVLGIPAVAAKDLPLSAAERARYVGTYTLTVGPRTLPLRVFDDDGRLRAQAQGQRAFGLMAQGEHRFVADVDQDIELTFTLADGSATALVLKQAGAVFTGERSR